MKMWTSLLLLLLLATTVLTVDSTNRDTAALDEQHIFVNPRIGCCPGGAPKAAGDIVECRFQRKGGSCATEAYSVKTTEQNTWQCISVNSRWLKNQLKTRSIKCN